MLFGSLSKLIHSRPHPRQTPHFDIPLTAKALEDIFSDCSDFSTREIAVGGSKTGKVTICYLDGVVDGTFLSDSVIRPLTEQTRLNEKMGVRHCIDAILEGAVWANSVSEKNTTDEVVDAITRGFTVAVFDKANTSVAFETKSGVQRSISEPNIEKSLKGAKDAFVERIRTNTMLVRRKLCTPSLKIRRTIVGRESETEIAILYVKGIADMQIVSEMEQRLNNIDIDGVLATGNIEEYICDIPKSPFPQVMYTERPDRLAIAMLDGRIGIIIDGIPLAFIAPCTLAQIMQASEDRSQHYLIASFLRCLRYIAGFITITLPAFYVAVAQYHQEMIPLKLLLSIIVTKQSVPFSTGVEIIALLIAFELLQEAGFRLPQPVGDTVSIIGALIVGQAAVEAKIIPPIAVIVVAVAGITNYTISNQDMSSALRLCRFFLVFCALLSGLFGLMAGLVIIVYHLSRLESFGVPYLSPLERSGPFGIIALAIRRPIVKDKFRAKEIDTPNRRNQR